MTLRTYAVRWQILRKRQHTSHFAYYDKESCVTSCLAVSPLKTNMRRGVFTTTRKLSVEDVSGKEDGKGERLWSNISVESKVIGSMLIAAASWLNTFIRKRRHARKELQLQLISRKIKELYGPLYSNRYVQMTTYKTSVGKDENLRNYIKRAKVSKDAEMIQRWRICVRKNLYPRDKEAEQLICKNVHLIANGDFPEEFKLFLDHYAKLQFVMQRWKNDGGQLKRKEDFTPDDFLEETNASGIEGLSKVLSHVEETHKELRKEQKKLTVELSAENGVSFLRAIFKKFLK